MEHRASTFGCLALVLGVVVALTPTRALADGGHVVDTWSPTGVDDANVRALNGSYTGFGAQTTGGEGRPLLLVTSLADGGIGSLRSVLDAAARLGGGRIAFAVAGDVVLLAELAVPANTTIDGLTAPAPGITLWGDRLSPGGGVLELGADNVVVRGLRIRNAVNDGIQIAAKSGRSVTGVVIDHCSITNSGDGGIDVTGADGARVSDVTLSWNYLAANGGPCASKTWCGGASLVKYGVTRISIHANVWDKNLRRNPSIAGAVDDTGNAADTLADVRANVVRGYFESGMQLRDGAHGNVIGNFFAGNRPLLTAGAIVFVAANDGATASTVASPFDVAEPVGLVDATTVTNATGAPPRDAIDTAYRDELTTYEAAKNAVVSPASTATSLATDRSTIGAASAPLDRATLAVAEHALRAARRARAHGDRARAGAEYEAVLTLLTGARGLYARPAEATMARASLGLSELAGRNGGPSVELAARALEHARRSGDAGLERRARHRLARLARH